MGFNWNFEKVTNIVDLKYTQYYNILFAFQVERPHTHIHTSTHRYIRHRSFAACLDFSYLFDLNILGTHHNNKTTKATSPAKMKIVFLNTPLFVCSFSLHILVFFFLILSFQPHILMFLNKFANFMPYF